MKQLHNLYFLFCVAVCRLLFVFLKLRWCVFRFTFNNFIQYAKNLLGNDHEIHNQEMKLFKFGFSILVKRKVFVAFVIAYSYQVLYVKKSQNFR